ncbi:MAG: lipase family protein [Oscillospiraceae bacterium]|nr:lipase family protein [Oscillospiraceae bacterium]
MLDERDRTAFSIAQKTLPDGSILLAVPVRGGNYGAEWVSNSNVGPSQNHAGFDLAATIVAEAVKARVASINDATRVKLWLTGFSRGAATANIATAKLDNWAVESDRINLTDIFSYTFATPTNTTDVNAKDAKYNNIFNIINPVDIVPIIPLGAWGFSRYGVDKYLQFLSKAEPDYDALNTAFADKFAGLYTGSFTAQLAGWEQYIALFDVSFIARQLVPSRSDFNAKLQGYLANIFRKYSDGTLTDLNNYRDFFLTTFGENQAQFWSNSKYTIGAALTLLSPLWDLRSAVDFVTFVFCSGTTLLGALKAPTVADVLDWLNSLYLVGGTDIFAFSSFFNNFIVSHTPESYLTLLNRGGGAEDKVFGSGTIKNVRVEGVSTATVLNNTGGTVAKIEGSTVTQSPLPAYINGSRKYFYLPTESSFTLELSADNSGKLELYIDTLNSLADAVRQTSFYDIASQNGQVWTASVPANSASYTLTDGGSTLSPNYDSLHVPADHTHDYGPWVVNRSATGGQLGEEYRTCTDCGKRESRIFLVYPDNDTAPKTVWGKIAAFFKRIWDWIVWFFSGGMFKK